MVKAERSPSTEAADGNVSSVAAKLMLITSPRWRLITYFSAATICGNPLVPSFSETGVSTSTIDAPGASTCAHSTSIDVSAAQPVRFSVGLNAGTRPAGWITRNDGGAGKPKVLSKCARSARIVGEPNESMITMVWRAPLIPLRSRGPRPYAVWTWAGDRPGPIPFRAEAMPRVLAGGVCCRFPYTTKPAAPAAARAARMATAARTRVMSTLRLLGLAGLARI
jgi:hypothetical protein